MGDVPGGEELKKAEESLPSSQKDFRDNVSNWFPFVQKSEADAKAARAVHSEADGAVRKYLST